MDAAKLQGIHDFLIKIAHEAGDMITAARPTTEGVGSKMNSADLVTETDRAVETMISTRLGKAYPDIEFMGEETYSPGTRLGDGPTFIVDPIDGTTNFVHSHPYVCISLGLSVSRTPVVGVVYNPFTKALYTAIRGQGAFLNRSERLPLRNPPEALGSLTTALIAVEWGADRSGNDMAVKANTFRRLCAAQSEGGAMVHSLRALGSAALNLCGVASGHLDAYWEGGCWAWDVCAGWCILAEAGGIMVDANPGVWDVHLESRRYFAVRGGEGQKAFVEEFWKNVQGRLEVGF